MHDLHLKVDLVEIRHLILRWDEHFALAFKDEIEFVASRSKLDHKVVLLHLFVGHKRKRVGNRLLLQSSFLEER